MSRALDIEYAYNHPPRMILWTLGLCWVFFAIAAISARLERSYGRVKFFVIFGALAFALSVTSKNAWTLLSPVF